MTRSILFGVIALGILRPAMLVGQVDSSRLGATRPQVRAMRMDTTSVRFQRPVSRVVLETAWAAADTQQRQEPAAVIRRPIWSSQVVLRQRLMKQRPTDPSPMIAILARRIPPRATVPATPADDSTIAQQRAGDFRVRAEAVARIGTIAPLRLNPAIAANLISELDSVGASRLAGAAAAPPAPDLPEEEEGYAEYVVGLSRSVMRLNDPRAIRALVLGGLGTSREIQRFVAAQGQAGLSALDTAFAASDASAPAVVTTWGYSLGASPSRLTFEDSVHVYARIVLSAQYYPVSFAYATRHARLFELMPELDSLAVRAESAEEPAVAGAARAASRALAPLLARAGAVDWLARLRLRTGVLCMDESRLGGDVCRAMLDATVSAAQSLGNLQGVEGAIGRYRAQVDLAVAAGRMSGEARAGLTPLVNGLLRASGDRRAVAPVARPDLLVPRVRRPR